MLTKSDVPGPDAPWMPDIVEFALSFDAYETMGGFDPLAKLANRSYDAWRSSGVLPDKLDDLRACLFFEQRRKRHMEQPPSHFPAEGE